VDWASPGHASAASAGDDRYTGQALS